MAKLEAGTRQPITITRIGLAKAAEKVGQGALALGGSEIVGSPFIQTLGNRELAAYLFASGLVTVILGVTYYVMGGRETDRIQSPSME